MPALEAVAAGFVAFLIGAAIVKLIRNIWDEWKGPEPRYIPDRSRMVSANVTDLQIYCQDCGAALISARHQDGFNPKTGEPVFSYSRHCPKLTPNPTDKNVNCGVRVKASAITGGHNHHDEEVTNTTCPACIDTMVANGGLTALQASQLYADAGIKPPRPETGADLYQAYLAANGGPVRSPFLARYLNDRNP